MIDPVTSYMGTKVDSYRVTEVRAVLEPVADFAEHFNIGIVGIAHPSKSATGKAINMVNGSGAFTAAPRQVHFAIDDPENSRRLFLPVKNSNGIKPPGLSYRCVQRIVSKNTVASYISWDSAPVSVTADQAIAAAAEAIKSGDQLGRAKGFLCDILADGAKLATEVQEAAEGRGLSDATRRAREKLHIEAFKEEFHGHWMWRLPEDAHRRCSNGET
jgi:hypothetical protein